MPDEKLKPCPFCKQDGSHHGFTVGKIEKAVFVLCERCEAQGPAGYTEAEAIELWNKREPSK